MSRLRARPEVEAKPRATLSDTVRAVAWSFFGIRRAADHEREVQRLNPLHVIIAGLLGAVAFVGLLVLLVRWVVGSGVAT